MSEPSSREGISQPAIAPLRERAGHRADEILVFGVAQDCYSAFPQAHEFGSKRHGPIPLITFSRLPSGQSFGICHHVLPNSREPLQVRANLKALENPRLQKIFHTVFR